MAMIESWARTYGPAWFGKPKRIDYVIVSEGKYNETFASSAMLAEWRVLGKAILKANVRRNFLKSSLAIRQKFSKFYNGFTTFNIAKLTNKKLYLLIKTIYEYTDVISYHFSVSQDASSDILLSRLTELLTPHGYKDMLSLLITQASPDILLREQRDLCRLGKKKFVSDKDLYRHAINYSILFYNSYNLAENLAYLRGRLHESFDFASRVKEMKILQREQNIIFEHIHNKEVKDICLFFQNLGIDRLELKNAWAGAEFRFLSLFKEVARRVYAPLTSMMASFTLKDYEDALVGGKNFSAHTMNHRAEHFVLWNKNGRIKLLETLEAIKPWLLLKRVAIGTNINSVFGTSANKGKVVGTVRIVKSLDITSVVIDLERFNQGDILVTWMTQPNMVPIARKAGAIVADEGGITSHAAVIAREFGVPCIVGAKIATKVFKDGDVVEVDGDNGVVRMIKQK